MFVNISYYLIEAWWCINLGNSFPWMVLNFCHQYWFIGNWTLSISRKIAVKFWLKFKYLHSRNTFEIAIASWLSFCSMLIVLSVRLFVMIPNTVLMVIVNTSQQRRMNVMTSQITGSCSTACSGCQQRKCQSSVLLALFKAIINVSMGNARKMWLHC